MVGYDGEVGSGLVVEVQLVDSSLCMEGGTGLKGRVGLGFGE